MGYILTLSSSFVCVCLPDFIVSTKPWILSIIIINYGCYIQRQELGDQESSYDGKAEGAAWA